MTKFQKISLFLLRISLGWLMFYAGVTKILNPAWSSEGYSKSAKMLAPLFNWFAQPGILPSVNFLTEWGLTLIGISLLLGIAVRLSAVFGVLLMVIFYLPILDFPYPNSHSFIVDEHVVYAFVFMVLAGFNAGRAIGLANWCASLPFCRKFPKLRSLIG